MKKLLSITALSLLAFPGQGWAADNAVLAEQIRLLIEQNRILQERVLNLEKLVGQELHAHAEPGLAKKPAGSAVDSITQRLTQVEELLATEEAKAGEKGLGEYVEFSGLVEVEAVTATSYDHQKSSDLSLATMELGLQVHISDWSHAQATLLYEEGAEDDDLEVDEATITLGHREKFPVGLTVGKKYLPFGSFLTSMVSDPLTLELGEINETVAQVGWQADGLYGSAYIFKSDIKEQGEEDKIRGYGVSGGLARQFGALFCDLGVGWLNNIADTDGLGEHLAADEVQEYVPGLAGHLLVSYEPYRFFAEYVGGLASFHRSEMAFSGQGARPRAWAVEVGYQTALKGRETLFALGYQGTDQALALELPEARYLATVRLTLLANTSLALEYGQDRDYDPKEGGTGKSGSSATLQLAVEF